MNANEKKNENKRADISMLGDIAATPWLSVV